MSIVDPAILRQRAEDAVAAFFGIDVRHIREAPTFCGDGHDGACQRGDCEVVKAVDLLLGYRAQEIQFWTEAVAAVLDKGDSSCRKVAEAMRRT